MARTRSLSPVSIKLDTPGSDRTCREATSVRTEANGVNTWPNWSVMLRRHCISAEHRMVEGVGVVDHRMDDRDLFLHVRCREAQIIDAAGVEIAAVALAGDIELGDARASGGPERIAEVIRRQTRVVVLQERLVGQQHAVPAPHPFVGDGELAGAFHAAAEIAIAG